MTTETGGGVTGTSKRKRSALLVILKTLLTLGVIGCAVHMLLTLSEPVSWRDASSRMQYSAFAGFAVIFSVTVMLRAVRFAVIARFATMVRWRTALIDYPWLFLVSAVTPFRAGDAWKAVWVHQQTPKGHARWQSAIFCLLMERLLDLVALIALLIIGLSAASLIPSMAEWSSTAYVALFAMVAAGGLAVSAALLWMIRSERFQKIGRSILEPILMMRPFVGTGQFAICLALTCLIWGGIVAGFVLAIDAVVANSTMFAAALAVSSANLVNLISVTPANVGTYEAAVLAALSAFGGDGRTSLLVGALIHIVSVGLVIVFGILSRIVSVTNRTVTSQQSAE